MSDSSNHDYNEVEYGGGWDGDDDDDNGQDYYNDAYVRHSHKSDNRCYYTYGRMAHVGLDSDDLYDPELEGFDDDESYNDDELDIDPDSEYWVEGVKVSILQKERRHQKNGGNHTKLARTTRAEIFVNASTMDQQTKPSPPPRTKGKQISTNDGVVRYPQQKQKQLDKQQKRERQERDCLYYYWPKSLPSTVQDEDMRDIWSLIWVMHIENVRTLPWSCGHYRMRNWQVAQSLLQNELEMKTTSPRSGQLLLKTSKEYGKVTLHATDPEKNKNMMFYVDSCLRTPSLDRQIRRAAAMTVDKEEDDKESAEDKKVSLLLPNDGGHASILDILAWHGFEVRLDHDGQNAKSTTATTTIDKKTLSRLRILNHGAFQFDRTVFVESDYFVFRSGYKRIHIPSERRLIALDHHRCYFFQFCTLQPKLWHAGFKGMH